MISSRKSILNRAKWNQCVLFIFVISCCLIRCNVVSAFTASSNHNNKMPMTTVQILNSNQPSIIKEQKTCGKSFIINDMQQNQKQQQYSSKSTLTKLYAIDTTTTDLEVISLVVGQANYGLAIVSIGEGIWSFVSAPPSLGNAIRVIGPNIIAAIILVVVSGPMVTSITDTTSIGNGLYIATAVTIGLGINYISRLFTPYPDTPKEIAFIGLLIAIAGFFTFSQNLIVDGFITLPTIQLPSLPSIELPSIF